MHDSIEHLFFTQITHQRNSWLCGDIARMSGKARSLIGIAVALKPSDRLSKLK